MSETKTVLTGICHFFSETGSEGGHWAFQDANYIQKNVPYGYCKKCGTGMNQSGILQIERVDPIDEDALHAGKVKKRPDCVKGAHEEAIGDRWSYEGLHVLKNGDHLTIYSKDSPEEIVWTGVIKLKQYPLFTEHASGMWIHADQKGIDRETWVQWFFDNYPATLVVG